MLPRLQGYKIPARKRNGIAFRDCLILACSAVLSDIDHPVFERCLAGLVTIDQHTLKLTSPVNLKTGPSRISQNQTGRFSCQWIPKHPP